MQALPVLHHPDLGPAGILFARADDPLAPNYTANCLYAYRLRYLHSGDKVRLNAGDNAKQNYRITDLKIMPKNALRAWLSNNPTPKTAITLSTDYPFTHCGHTSILQYVVFASPSRT